jgi:hypothetical protein
LALLAHQGAPVWVVGAAVHLTLINYREEFSKILHDGITSVNASGSELRRQRAVEQRIKQL